MKCFVAHSRIHNYHIAWVVLTDQMQYMELDLMPCVPQELHLGGGPRVVGLGGVFFGGDKGVNGDVLFGHRDDII